MHKFFIFAFIVIFSFAANAKDVTKGQTLIGQGSLHFLFWHIYDVSLYAKDKFSFDRPFILKIDYKRKLYGDKIADRSVEEIRKIGFTGEVKLAGWHSQMKEIFPDVDNGTSLIGTYQPDLPTIFYKGNLKIGEIKDPEFGRWFFGIWLNKNTSEPGLRQNLLGDINAK